MIVKRNLFLFVFASGNQNSWIKIVPIGTLLHEIVLVVILLP